MNVEQLKAELTQADNDFIEHTGKQSYCNAHLRLYTSDSQWEADMWAFKDGSNQHITGKGDTPAEAVADLRAKIAAMPSQDEMERQEFQAQLGKLIDKGREINIDVEFLNPLTAMAKKLSENAITDQRGAA